MGVYIFRSLHLPWIKIGHHRITDRRPNVYYRVANRGFNSCVHPPELEGKLALDDFELVAWYPTLDRRDESAAHRACRSRWGEFHPLEDLSTALAVCDSRGNRQGVPASDKDEALVWARKQVGCVSHRVI